MPMSNLTSLFSVSFFKLLPTSNESQFRRVILTLKWQNFDKLLKAEFWRNFKIKFRKFLTKYFFSHFQAATFTTSPQQQQHDQRKFEEKANRLRVTLLLVWVWQTVTKEWRHNDDRHQRRGPVGSDRSAWGHRWVRVRLRRRQLVVETLRAFQN